MQSSLKCIRWSQSLNPQTLSHSRDQKSLTVKGKSQSLQTCLLNLSHIYVRENTFFFHEHILCLWHISFHCMLMLHDLTSHISTSTWHVFWVLQFLPRCFLPPLTFFFYTTLFYSCQIDWHKGKDVTVKTIKKKQKHKGRGTVRTVTKQVPNDSFFNFFNPIKGENLHGNRHSSLRLHRTSVQVKNSYLTPKFYLTYQ